MSSRVHIPSTETQGLTSAKIQYFPIIFLFNIYHFIIIYYLSWSHRIQFVLSRVQPSKYWRELDPGHGTNVIALLCGISQLTSGRGFAPFSTPFYFRRSSSADLLKQSTSPDGAQADTPPLQRSCFFTVQKGNDRVTGF